MKKKEFDKIIIYFFSGTGNAKNVAYWFANEAMKKEIPAEIFDISKIDRKNTPTPPINSLVVFAGPTHGFNFPDILRNFIFRFPKSKNVYTCILNTRAGFRIGNLHLFGLSGITHYLHSFILLTKGYKIRGLRQVDLPSNWLLLHPAIRPKGVKKIYERKEKKIRAYAQRILSGKTGFRALFDIIQDILISPISILYMFFGKYLLSKTLIASKECTNCQLCINTCPVNAIKIIDNRMFWTYKCESCMKCVNSCPTKAIQTTLPTWLLFLYVFFIFFNYGFLKLISAFSVLNSIEWIKSESVMFLIGSIITMPALFLFYRFQHYLMKFKFFERLITYLTFSKYKFWGRYKAPRPKF